jgi:biopolymer transport protein ExbD
MEGSQPWSVARSPMAEGTGAQLILAILLAALLPLFILTLPVQTHAVKLDLPALPETAMPTNPFPPQAYLLTSLILPDPVPARPRHELVITAGGQVLMDGSVVDLLELRQRLDHIETTEKEWVDLRPDPDARYELFAEILAVVKRARLERLRLDSRPFRSSLDDGPAFSAAKALHEGR